MLRRSLGAFGLYSLRVPSSFAHEEKDREHHHRSLLDSAVFPVHSNQQKQQQLHSKVGLRPLHSSLLHGEITFASPHFGSNNSECRFQIVYDPRTRAPKYVVEHMVSPSNISKRFVERRSDERQISTPRSWLSFLSGETAVSRTNSAGSTNETDGTVVTNNRNKKLRRRTFYTEDALPLDAFKVSYHVTEECIAKSKLNVSI